MERLFEQFRVYLLTEKRVSNHTLDAYCADLRQFLDFIADRALRPEDIRPADLKAFLAHLKKNELSSEVWPARFRPLRPFLAMYIAFMG